MRGRAAIARATPTRWRWPPESVSGKRSAVFARQAHEIEQLVHARGDGGAVPAQELGRDRDVLGDRQVREQPDLLEHIADAPAQLGGIDRRHLGVEDADRAGGRIDQPVDDLEQRRLAGPGFADDDEELAATDVEPDVADGVVRAALIGLGCAPDRDRDLVVGHDGSDITFAQRDQGEGRRWNHANGERSGFTSGSYTGLCWRHR